MAYRIIQELPSAEEVRERFPIGADHRVEEHRQEIRNILTGEDRRLIAVVGPCSSWPSEAVYKYADRAARLAEEIRTRVLPVMRLYIQKPRTTLGWPGPLTQPDPLAPADIQKGIWQCREMMWRVGQQHPLADEMLFTNNEGYFVDGLSYIAIGARSTADQEHRFIASGLFETDDDCPVGIKNPVDGDIAVGVDGVECAQHPHTFAWRRHTVETQGNPYAHLILRGGKGGSNYDPASLALAAKQLKSPKREIRNPAVLIDASHDNCQNGNGKDPILQAHVVHTVLGAMERGHDGYEVVKGFMLESFLKNGRQNIGPDMDMDGLSITDPCLGWEDTERLLRETADAVDRIMGKASGV